MPTESAERTETGRIVTWTMAEEMMAGWPVIHQMYTKMTREEYADLLKQIEGMAYRQFAYIANDGKCLGVVGLWCFTRVWCGKHIDIDNFVVDRDARSQGVGKQLLEQCMRYGEEQGANIAVLDTFVDNPASHRFYFREGFSIRGYHFVKPLKGQSIW